MRKMNRDELSAEGKISMRAAGQRQAWGGGGERREREPAEKGFSAFHRGAATAPWTLLHEASTLEPGWASVWCLLPAAFAPFSVLRRGQNLRTSRGQGGETESAQPSCSLVTRVWSLAPSLSLPEMQTSGPCPRPAKLDCRT